MNGLKGGEDEAMNRLENYFFKLKGLKNYKGTRNGLIGVDYSSKLSLWLAYGCISARYNTTSEKWRDGRVWSPPSTPPGLDRDPISRFFILFKLL